MSDSMVSDDDNHDVHELEEIKLSKTTKKNRSARTRYRFDSDESRESDRNDDLLIENNDRQRLTISQVHGLLYSSGQSEQEVSTPGQDLQDVSTSTTITNRSTPVRDRGVTSHITQGRRLGDSFGSESTRNNTPARDTHRSTSSSLVFASMPICSSTPVRDAHRSTSSILVSPSTPNTNEHCTTRSGTNINSTSRRTIDEKLDMILNGQQEINERLRKIERDLELASVQNKKTSKNDENIKVPNGVKNAVKYGYKDGNERGLKWHFDGSKRMTDAENRMMSDHIITFVKGYNPTYSDHTVINCAMSRYFLTKKQEESSKQKDRHITEKKRRASYERKKEKAKRRRTALEKFSCTDAKRAIIKDALQAKYMSSDEDNGEEGFITHQPSWQSAKFRQYKETLDNTYKQICTKSSLRLLQKRTIGTSHDKEAPEVPEQCRWILKE